MSVLLIELQEFNIAAFPGGKGNLLGSIRRYLQVQPPSQHLRTAMGHLVRLHAKRRPRHGHHVLCDA